MRVEFSRRFIKELKKCTFSIRQVYQKKLELFFIDRYAPTLNNHALGGKLSGYCSFNVTGDWRAIFKEFNQGEEIYFIILGTHSKLYR